MQHYGGSHTSSSTTPAQTTKYTNKLNSTRDDHHDEQKDDNCYPDTLNTDHDYDDTLNNNRYNDKDHKKRNTADNKHSERYVQTHADDDNSQYSRETDDASDNFFDRLFSGADDPRDDHSHVQHLPPSTLCSSQSPFSTTTPPSATTITPQHFLFLPLTQHNDARYNVANHDSIINSETLSDTAVTHGHLHERAQRRR
jgi:hypothetical protein